jgi:hypothetical protein
MRRPSRMRRWFKWCGLVLSMVIAIFWVVSLNWVWICNIADTRVPCTFKICNGGLDFYHYRERASSVFVRWHVRRELTRPIWKPGFFLITNAYWGWGIHLSFWIPFLFVAIPTAFLFWHDRRILGYCLKCDYNLTGNISGVCPECGEKI